MADVPYVPKAAYGAVPSPLQTLETGLALAKPTVYSPMPPTPSVSIDTVVEAATPTEKPVSLDEATDYFRENYIPEVARLTGKSTISQLRKPSALDYDRSELSRIVGEYGLRPVLDELKERPRPEDDIPYELDPIAKRVMREAIHQDYFGLTEMTERFKDIYVNNLARYFGVPAAAAMLGVSEKTVGNRMKSYSEDERNRLVFPDDKRVEPNLEQIAEANSSVKKQAEEVVRLWEQQQMQRAHSSLN